MLITHRDYLIKNICLNHKKGSEFFINYSVEDMYKIYSELRYFIPSAKLKSRYLQETEFLTNPIVNIEEIYSEFIAEMSELLRKRFNNGCDLYKSLKAVSHGYLAMPYYEFDGFLHSSKSWNCFNNATFSDYINYVYAKFDFIKRYGEYNPNTGTDTILFTMSGRQADKLGYEITIHNKEEMNYYRKSLKSIVQMESALGAWQTVRTIKKIPVLNIHVAKVEFFWD